MEQMIKIYWALGTHKSLVSDVISLLATYQKQVIGTVSSLLCIVHVQV